VQDAERSQSPRCIAMLYRATRPRELPSSVNALMSGMCLAMRSAVLFLNGLGARPIRHDAHAECYGSDSKLPCLYMRLWFQTGYMKVVVRAVCWPMCDASSNSTYRRDRRGSMDRRTPHIGRCHRRPRTQSVTQTHAHRELIRIRTPFRVQFELQRVDGQRCSPRV
jgi:hypothetical protein